MDSFRKRALKMSLLGTVPLFITKKPFYGFKIAITIAMRFFLKNPIFKRFLTVYLLISCQSLWANNCKDLFRLSENNIQIARYRAVQQCRGTCYFEASVAHMENALSRKYGNDIVISRVLLFAELIKSRMKSDFLEWENSIKKSLEDGLVLDVGERPDIITYGRAEEVLKIMKEEGVFLFDQSLKRGAYIAAENLRLTKMEEFLSKKMTSLNWGEITGKELHQSLMKYLNEIKRDEIIKIQKLARSYEDIFPMDFFKPKNFQLVFEPNQVGQLETRIIDLVDKNKGMFLSYNTTNNDVISSSGRMKVFSIKPITSVVGHAVLVVGYKLKEDGQIEYLRIRNSYGEVHGDLGYFNMSFSYFKERIMSIHSMKELP